MEEAKAAATALNILASSPSAARHISYELAQYFVADNPPQELVDRLAQRFLATDGDIRPVLEALFKSLEFRDSQDFLREVQDALPIRDLGSARGRRRGEQCPTLASGHVPNGNALVRLPVSRRVQQYARGWLNPDALAQRISFATGMGLGRTPLGEVIDDTLEKDPYASRAPEGVAASRPEPQRVGSADGPPLDASAVLATLKGQISTQTRATIASLEDSSLDAALVLGSPDFMRR